MLPTHFFNDGLHRIGMLILVKSDLSVLFIIGFFGGGVAFYLETFA